MFEIAGQAFNIWTCEICGYMGEHNTTATSQICDGCAELTKRCSKCGRLEK